MRVIAVAAILMVFMGVGCTTHQSEIVGAPSKIQSEQITANDLIGVWRANDSTSKFRIFIHEGRLMIEGWDSSDNERFEISDISLEGRTLRFTSRMPSTNWTVHRQCTIINNQEMQIYRSGANSKASKYFKE
jgi:hypothetical protein